MTHVTTPYLTRDVPSELFEHPNWICYRLEPKPNGKTDKKPVNPKTGFPASTTDPATWGTVDHALRRAEDDLLAGVGFVFTNSPYCGVDLDGCINGTGIEPWASEYIRLVDSYTEVSQSGTGIHIISRGDLPQGGRRRGKVEMYDSGRFFVMTGQHVEGTPKAINERTEALAELHRRVFGIREPHERTEVITPSPDDQTVIKWILDPTYGNPALWVGNYEGYDSPSEADLALCSHLSHWTHGNAEQIDRLFRQSGLYRPKWDERRGDQTYGRLTIEKALNAGFSENGPQPVPQPPTPTTPTITIHWARGALEPQPPIEWIIEDLFSVGSVSLLVGEPGSKKTYTLLDAAVCVALGDLWLGRITTPCTVLLIDEESGPRRLARRIGNTLRGHDAGPDTPFAYVTLAGFDLRNAVSTNALQTVIMAIEARFVILDCLVDFMPGGDENSVKEVQPVFHNLRMVAEATQSGVVMIHHTNKAGGYRGSSAMKGACDLMLIAESKPDSPDITFRTEKARDIEPVTFGATAHFEQDTFYLSPEEPGTMGKHFTRAERYVLRYLCANGESSIDDIKNHADVCSEQSARQAVYSLVEKGEIERTDGGGRGTRAVYGLTSYGVVSCDEL